MEDNNFEDTEKCPYVGGSDDGEHYYKRVEEWDGERWISQEQCAKCEHAIDSQIFNGCKRAFNRKHSDVFSSMIDENGVKFITRTCTNCKQSHTYQSQIRNIKWKEKN